jgi:hypothetical protein
MRVDGFTPAIREFPVGMSSNSAILAPRNIIKMGGVRCHKRPPTQDAADRLIYIKTNDNKPVYIFNRPEGWQILSSSNLRLGNTSTCLGD